MPSNSSTVSLSVTGPGSLSGPTSVKAVNGQATFSGLILKNAGSYTLKFTDGAFTSVSTTVTVAPAAANHLAFGQQPTSSTAGQAISPAITVRLFDAYNNLATTTNANVTLAVATGGVSNSMLANMMANTIKGTNTGVAGAPLDLTVAQVSTLLGLGPLATQAIPATIAQGAIALQSAGVTLTFIVSLLGPLSSRYIGWGRTL